MSEINQIKPLKYWVQKVLPLVYEDSLSYYELLNKVVLKLNQLIENNDNLPAYIRDLIAELITPESIEEILSEIFDSLRKTFAEANDYDSPTTTEDRDKGDWVWVNDKLYIITRDIEVGTAYITTGDNPNAVLITMEGVIDGVYDTVNNLEDDILERVNELDSNIRHNISSKDDGASGTARADRNKGTLVWLNDNLYIALRDIESGDAYVSVGDNPNIQKITVEEYVNIVKSDVSDLETVCENIENSISINNEGDNTVASSDRSIGDLVWLNNVLYRITASILEGEEYVVDTNCVVISIEEVITLLKSDITTILTSIENGISAHNEGTNTTASANRSVGDLVWLNNTLYIITSAISTGGNYVVGTNCVATDIETVIKNLSDSIDSRIALTQLFATPQKYGAVGNGVANDYTALTNLFNNESQIYIPDGVYRTSNQISIGSNKFIFAGCNAIILGSVTNNAIIKITGGNVSIYNLTIEGYKGQTGASGTEYNHGIYMASPNTVYLYGVKVKNVFGDGFYLGNDGETVSQNTILDGCRAIYCGRNGYSVIASKEFKIVNCSAYGTSGNNPQMGIDIEPNSPNVPIKGIISNFTSSQNTNGGIQMYFTQEGVTPDIIIDNCLFVEDSSVNGRYVIGIRDDVGLNGGSISISNVVMRSCRSYGLSITGMSAYFTLQTKNIVLNNHLGPVGVRLHGNAVRNDEGYYTLDVTCSNRSSLMTYLLQVSHTTYALKNVIFKVRSLFNVNDIESGDDVKIINEFVDKEVIGTVRSNGTIISTNYPALGVTVSRSSVGNYSITLPFDPSYVLISVTNATPHIVSSFITNNVVTVRTATASGTLEDSGFNFYIHS